MDSILALGPQDQKLSAFLKKMGYELIEFDGTENLSHLVDRHVFDLVLVDTNMELNSVELCQFLRSHEPTKGVPIVCMAHRPRMRQDIKDLGLDRIEVFDFPYPIGRVVSSIATQLRMTKNAGSEERSASLFEVNAALRDLNTRFQKDLEEARSIQAALLPKPLAHDERFSLTSRYEPLEQVGGDWYFYEQFGDELSIQIADVTGHGLGAAFIGCMTKLAMSAAGRSRPDELMTEMNRLMSPQLPPGRFVTMGSFRYNAASGLLEFARGGHPPALHLSRKSGEVTQLLGDGFPIGFFEDSKYEHGSTTLEPGDLLVVLTDGIPEMQNRALKTYGFDRMAEILRAAAPETSTDELCTILLNDANAYREGRLLKDDVTLIILKREK